MSVRQRAIGGGVEAWIGAVLFLAMTLGTGTASADVRLPALFGDHMVVQQAAPVRVWGWADAGEGVTVRLAGQEAKATADERGQWSVQLPPLAAGGPHTLDVVGKNTLRVTDVLVGEVWIASGQSNMEFSLAQAANAKNEIAAASYPRLRHFTVAKAMDVRPRSDVTGSWQVCSPETAGGFSAVGYFFARDLIKALDVPVGIIHTSWGGTPAEAWTSREALAASPELRKMVEDFDRRRSDPAARAEYERALAAWEAQNVASDTGNEGQAAGFARPDLDATQWQAVEMPQRIEQAGFAIDGAIWFRRDVEIPAAWAGKDLTLALGPIDDFDTTYFAGVEVGHIGKETPGYYTYPRRCTVPAALVKAGRTTIAVRVFDRAGEGGFGGGAKDLTLGPAAGGEAPLGLAGTWLAKVERAVGPLSPNWGTQPTSPEDQNAPTTLYNAMLAPLTPFAIKGAIWYQGESNAARAYQYRTLFPSMIRDWRRAFGQGDFPFHFVQLANFMARDAEPAESEWAELREAQALTLAEPATGMAVIIDIGEGDNIHPRNKQDVGRRLALNALARTYGRALEYSGPTYRSMGIEGSAARLTLDHAQGLVAKGEGGVVKGFAIAGADRKFVWAEARIEGQQVVVSSPKVQAPVAVRYGWGNNPEVNLYNAADLPAAPFRTDDWPGLTSPRD
jgi:sialate O-acetylesterase